MAATIIGTICGGVVNFLLGRQWVFKGKGISIHRQASRYSLVWSGNFLLNVSGVFVMTGYLHANYILSKVFVSIVIGCTYNYLLQKEYVFR
jgi:putative flippase GtrA